MALRFAASDAVSDLYVDKFGGVDFSTTPSKVELNRSDDAKNMIINEDGFLEKRCGYKKLFEGEGDVNGIFEYIADPRSGEERKTFYFIHRGSALYQFEFDGKAVVMHDTPLLEGLENKKTRSFFMGGALFIIGGGRYIKIMYDTDFDILVYGFVDECDTDTEPAVFLTDRTVDKLDGQYLGYNAKHLFLKISYKQAKCTFYTREDSYWTKFYIAGPEAKNIRVAGAYVNSEKVDWQNLMMRADETGIYAVIKCSGSEKIPSTAELNCSVDIIVSINNFVYTPTIITGRKNVAKTDDPSVRYTGNVLESVNLISRKRAIEIEYNRVLDTEDDVSYVYLENGADMISALYINGQPVSGWGRGGSDEPAIRPVGILYGNIVIYQDEIQQDAKHIRIEYIAKNGDEGKINRCSISGMFGGENDTRVFLAGDSHYPETDYASGLYEATYFPDTGYTKIGADSSAIVGYHKLYSNQIIIKDGRGADASQYIRKFDIDDNGKVYFPVSQGALGYGASNISSFKTVNDIPMFAGPGGVFSVQGTVVENQNNTVCRSKLINARLCRENICDGICTAKDNKYYLYFPSEKENDGRMYVYDTNQGEWFYFADLPGDISCIWIYDDRICFGRRNGEICMFLNPDDENPYYDGIDTDGGLGSARAIEAYWSVPATDMGDGMKKKTIVSAYVTCRKYLRSGVKLHYRSNFHTESEAASDNCDLFCFEDINFNRFSFDTVSCPVSINSHAKDKRPEVFGFKIQNSNPGEPMGILGFGIRYRTGRYIK